MRRFETTGLFVIAVVAATAIVAPSAEPKRAQEPAKPPSAYTLVRTSDGSPTDIDFFYLNKDCAVCHERQLREITGSMHSASHSEPLYRHFAELARKEAGDEIYALCSGCHSPAGVVSGLIPAKRDPQLPPEAKAGVTCDVCHQISALTGAEGPWHEPGNASFVLEPGRVKFGPTDEVAENRSHTGEKREFFSKAEFCASCHTVIHPINGLRIEDTYSEWKSSLYAEKGIQCQDCHMRSVEDAVKVAQTLQPVVVKGPSANEGPTRQIYPHFFVGGNANADYLAGGKSHAAMAAQRLKSAARVEIKAPENAAAGAELAFDVLVHNEAAGHNIPTGITEVRQMWVEVEVLDSHGKSLLRRGGLDPHGELLPETIRFGAVAGDADGKETVRPWEMKSFLWKRTVPPKSFTRDSVTAKLPAGLSGGVTILAKLFYRSAPPSIVKLVMPEEPFTAKIVEMSSAKVVVPVR